MQQSLYVLQMPPAAISHLYSLCSEWGIARTYHCSLKEDDDVLKGLLIPALQMLQPHSPEVGGVGWENHRIIWVEDDSSDHQVKLLTQHGQGQNRTMSPGATGVF